MRADAKRNYDKIVTAARETFAENGSSTSLEAVARRAGVGIGTLYRHFPTRQALLEAVYIGEVQQLCSATQELLALPPWESFVALSHRLVTYLATKKALAHELMNYVDREAAFFKSCRADLFIAGEPVLQARPRGRRSCAPTPTSPRSSSWSAESRRSRRPLTGSVSTSSTSRSTDCATATDRAGSSGRQRALPLRVQRLAGQREHRRQVAVNARLVAFEAAVRDAQDALAVGL